MVRVLLKALGALTALFLIIVVGLLCLLLFMFFSEHFFNPEALLNLAVGLSLLWANFRHQATTTAAFVLDLLALPIQLLLICGAMASILLSGAAKFLPESWEWPANPMSSVITFESGKKAALLENLWRVQVYDASGRFEGGWFLDTPSSIFLSPELYRNEYGLPGEEETIIIRRVLENQVTLYDLSGRVVATRKRDYEKQGYPMQTAADFPAIFAVPWYQWPLASESNALTLTLIGICGSVVLIWLRRFFEPPKNTNKDKS